MDLSPSPIFIVLHGKTGSGKTKMLHQLESCGYPVIDLEKIASHRGSAFGGLLLDVQPSQSDFDCKIEASFSKLEMLPYIFIENKPASLGKRKIPDWLYGKMKQGISVVLDTDKKIRINNILNEYKAAGKDGFIHSLHKLKERLPDTVIKECEANIRSDHYEKFIENIITYYDSTDNYNAGYYHIKIMIENNSPSENMIRLIEELARYDVFLNLSKL